MKTKYFLLTLAVSLMAQLPVMGQFPGFPRVNRDSLRALSVADHARMLQQLGIKEVRPGRDPNTPDSPLQPNYNELEANPYLYYPNPLLTFSGLPVTDARMWREVRRPELVHAFETELYGCIPDNVPAVNWEVVKEEHILMEDIPCIQQELAGVVDNSAYPEISVRIQASLVWPEAAAPGIPVVMEFGFMLGDFTFPGMPKTKSWRQQVVERGWAAAVIVTGSIQADGGYGLRSGIIGLCNKGQDRHPKDWGALRAWAWGASRLLDYLDAQPQFDATKVAIEGCSRNGKASLVTMAFDERFAAGFISSSGEGGASPWRRNIGESLENLTSPDEYHWMAGNFLCYGADPFAPDNLPVDQHELIALCAPRACFISSGVWEADKWQDLMGMFLSTVKATPVYNLLGVGGLDTDVYPGTDVGLLDAPLAFRQHHGGHESGPNWPYFLDFFNKFVVSPDPVAD